MQQIANNNNINTLIMRNHKQSGAYTLTKNETEEKEYKTNTSVWMAGIMKGTAKKVAKNFLFNICFPFLVFLSALDSNYIYFVDGRTVTVVHLPSPVRPSFGRRFFICLHFSDNVHITNVMYVSSTQSFMLTHTETYSFSLCDTLSACTMYYTHTSLADAIFRISLVFYSNTREFYYTFSFVQLMIFHSL